MAGLGRTAEKLLTALNRAGADITLDKRVFFSRSYGRILTKYIVRERDAQSGKRVRLLESYRLKEVVTLLAERYEELRGWARG